MFAKNDILIVGGYGIVGQRIAADLAPDYLGRIVVAGRNIERATQFATALGHDVRGRPIDVDDPASIEAALGGVSWYGLVVEVRGTRGTARVSLAGHGQADATAIGAAALGRALYEGEVERPGIWLAEQIVPPGPFLDRLAARGLVPLIEVALVPQPVG